MYLYEADSYIPRLNLLLNEPKRLQKWINNLPMNKMTELWRLDASLQAHWFDHFYSKIYTPCYQGATVSANGIDLVGGPVAQVSIQATNRRFADWIDSTQNADLFRSVKLKEFGSERSLMGPLMLAPDIICNECEAIEPAYLFMGTNESSVVFHEQYKPVEKLLNGGMFCEYWEQETCFSCDPEHRYITPMMRRYARNRPGSCECMPCRESL